eukprot:COSAG06_NODE_21535_length_753_cov_39.571865_1_plen_134_part_10
MVGTAPPRHEIGKWAPSYSQVLTTPATRAQSAPARAAPPEMQQQPVAPSQDEGVPPAAAPAAREAQQGRAVREEPPVAEQPAAAPTPITAAPLKPKLCAELKLLLARVQAAGPEIDLAVAMVHVSQAQLAVAAA